MTHIINNAISDAESRVDVAQAAAQAARAARDARPMVSTIPGVRQCQSGTVLSSGEAYYIDSAIAAEADRFSHDPDVRAAGELAHLTMAPFICGCHLCAIAAAHAAAVQVAEDELAAAQADLSRLQRGLPDYVTAYLRKRSHVTAARAIMDRYGIDC